jgi:WD40 repeat protein
MTRIIRTRKLGKYVVPIVNGTRLATGSEDQTIKLWDAATGEEVLTLRSHTGVVSSVAFSPDGRLLGSASADGTVQVREAESPATLSPAVSTPESRNHPTAKAGLVPPPRAD